MTDISQRRWTHTIARVDGDVCNFHERCSEFRSPHRSWADAWIRARFDSAGGDLGRLKPPARAWDVHWLRVPHAVEEYEGRCLPCLYFDLDVRFAGTIVCCDALGVVGQRVLLDDLAGIAHDVGKSLVSRGERAIWCLFGTPSASLDFEHLRAWEVEGWEPVYIV